MENQHNRAENNSRKGFISAIVVLLLLNIFTLYMFFNVRTQKIDLTSQKTELQHQFRDLSDTLNLRNTEVEQFIGKNTELDKAIAEKQEQMDNQKKEIQRLFSKNKMTQAELTKARDLIAQYQTSITDMTAKVDQLTKENAELTASNQKLSTDLTAEKSTTSQLTETNKGLSKKVEAGSLFQIAKVDVAGVKTKGNGKEVEVRKAKAAQNLRIKFETGENRVLDPGTVPLYVRIIDPKGQTIAVADQGSGTIPSADSQEPIQYTKKADIDYNQTNKTVVVYWGMNIKEPGTYKVEVIQSGHVVGTGAVQLS
jgi:predicted RNase H-like nuclease (RuvC/YqgF family)